MALVRKLRSERTEGLMDCRKALIDAGWDYDKAKELLRKEGVRKT
jgi:elongation factor Ts